MKLLSIILPATLFACQPTPPTPQHPAHWAVDKAWETDAIWYEYCQTHPTPMCYGAVYTPPVK